MQTADSLVPRLSMDGRKSRPKGSLFVICRLDAFVGSHAPSRAQIIFVYDAW